MKPWGFALAVKFALPLPFAVHCALLPSSPALIQPSLNLTAHGSLASTIDLPVPGTATTLTFSTYGSLLSQSELDLCVIEGLAHTLSIILSLKRDAFLPRSSFKEKWGEVEISVTDFKISQAAARMTYAVVANMLRGVALFMSLYGWFEVLVGVFDGEKGQVGTGRVRRVGRGE